jgi:hypothetical protein
VNNQELVARRTEILKETALKIQKKAQAGASRPMGLGAGTKNNKLVPAIRIEGPETSSNGKRVQVRVIADQEMAPHALWQEYGTGIYGTATGARGEVIFPTQKKLMAWDPKGQTGLYKGGGVWTGVHTKGKFVRGKQRKELWQFAAYIKGVRPKHFMRDARNDPQIKSEYLAEIAKTVKIVETK